MLGPIYQVRSRVRRFAGHAGWHFVLVDRAQSKEIKALGLPRRGWDSVRVTVRLGTLTWRTSIFYMKEERQYVMGLKAAVRTKEGVQEGSVVTFSIHIRDD